MNKVPKNDKRFVILACNFKAGPVKDARISFDDELSATNLARAFYHHYDIVSVYDYVNDGFIWEMV